LFEDGRQEAGGRVIGEDDIGIQEPVKLSRRGQSFAFRQQEHAIARKGMARQLLADAKRFAEQIIAIRITSS
jgi:hypothetical protein